MSEQHNNLHASKLKNDQQLSQITKFIRSVELKQKAIGQLGTIYAKNVMSPHFESTFKAAVALIFIPSLTNIYYALRPNSPLAGVMPFAVPLLCLGSYIYFLNKDLQKFCFTSQSDAEIAREQYEIIYEFSYYNRAQNQFMTKIQNYREDQKKQREAETII